MEELGRTWCLRVRILNSPSSKVKCSAIMAL